MHHAFWALPQLEMYLKSSGAVTILPAGCGSGNRASKKKELATAPAFFGDRNVCGMYGNPIGRCKVAVPISPVAQTVFQSVAQCRNTSLFDASFGPRHSRDDPWFCLSRA